MVYNRFGQELSESEQYQPLKPEFFSENGYPKWELISFGDQFGFDVRRYDSLVWNYILPVGTRICRYGSISGRFSTDPGTEYNRLSLPYTEKSMPYHEYIVEGECQVKCVVDKGIVAPGFSSPGGAIQYMHHIPIDEALKTGILKEDMSWLTKM